MARRRKRWLIVTVLALLVAGSGFYYFYFMSTAAAIRHAEAFRFRRMAVTRLGEEGSYRHFFVTNRTRESTDSPLQESFGAERGELLSFGSFDARLEPSLGLGMIINPTQWLQDEEIKLDAVRDLGRDDFLGQLRRMIDQSPGRSLLIVIHGFRESYASALRKTAFIASVLDLNTPVMLFDWPGDQGSSLRGYRRAREVAEASAGELARTLELIATEVGPDRLAILANSMGGQVVVDALHLLYARQVEASTPLHQVILTAPDVAHADLDARFREEIRALARRLTVYVSSNDRALLMSRVINRAKRAGESTLSPEQFDEATLIFDLLEADSDLITLVDVTPVNRTRNFHNFSLETPEFFDDLYLRLTSDGLPRSRLLYPVRNAQGSVYWVLTRGR